jgi:peptidoglycan/xylan/chitin deacetylase (PgdA/CDA1 family)
MLRPLNDNHANLLLNCAPDKRGILHEETVALLEEVGRMWDPDEASQSENELYGISRAPVKIVPTNDKKVAITFAPSWSAEQCMTAAARLKESKAAGTFFVNEATATAEKTSLRTLVEAGHEIGNGSKNDSPLTSIEKARMVNKEVDAVQKQLGAVQSPKMFRSPGNQYNESVWSVLNYQRLTALEGIIFSGDASVVAPGSIIEVATIEELDELLAVIKEADFTAVTASDLFASSTSLRLRNVVAEGSAGVVTGRE